MMHRGGFTLIELSIVLVIVGLIVAGVTAGQSLIRAAEVQKVVFDINSYATAYNTFKLKYDAIPGDFNEANDYWSSTASGDGDNTIDTDDERYDAWQQLNLAELIGFNATGDDAGTPNYQGGVNMPESSVQGGIFILSDDEYGMWGGRNAICFASDVGLPCNNAGSAQLYVEDAIAIDKKLDDGLAQSGILLTAGCNISGLFFGDVFSLSIAGAAYDKDGTTTCEMAYLLD